MRIINELLRETGKDHFYLMHLSYRKHPEERADLWAFAKEEQLIGMGHKKIKDRWDRISDRKKKTLSPQVRTYFDLFTNMKSNDIVVVGSGKEGILGVGLVEDEISPYKYDASIGEDFFSHVRGVDWEKTYSLEDSIPVDLPWFQGTMYLIDQESPHWENLRRLDFPVDGESRTDEERYNSHNQAQSTSGQGLNLLPSERKEIDRHAMKMAMQHFQEELGEDNVRDRHIGHPFDLVCFQDGAKFYVEVKGTKTHGGKIILTKREVNFVLQNRSRKKLFILHSVRLDKGRAHGGEQRIIDNWRINEANLDPISYFYNV